MWVYVSSLPVIPKQPHKPTWAEVVGHHLSMGSCSVSWKNIVITAPSLELMCFLPSLPPFLPSLPPCPSLFPFSFLLLLLCSPQQKRKKKEERKKKCLWESLSPRWQAPCLWCRCAGSPPPCRRHSNWPALIC